MIRPPTITIHLDHQTTLGRCMVFVPAGRAHYFSEHPTTTELKEILARTHQVHQADRVHALHELAVFFNVVCHSGYEYHRCWFMDSWVKYISNTPTNHIMHHEKMRGNYGRYFSFWDHVMRTNHADYETRFREVASRLSEPREKTANSVAAQHS